MSNSRRRVKPAGAASLGVGPSADDLQAYEAGVDRLVKRLRLMNESAWSPTPKRRAAEDLAAKLVDLADYLDETGTLQFDVEELHDRPPPLVVGDDGWLQTDTVAESWHLSYKATIWRMRDLADSARRVANELPNPRANPALPFAALVFLHLRYRCGFPRPSLYDLGEDMQAFQRVTEAAGIVREPQTLRGPLSAALKEFDPKRVPHYLADFL